MGRKSKRTPEKRAAEARMAAKLDALYAQLPALECKGLCAHSCLHVEFTPGERNRVRRETGVDIPLPDQAPGEGDASCPALEEGRCTVHPVRPMICRLWGIDERMKCKYGCVPDGGWLPAAEASRFLTKAQFIAGDLRGAAHLTPREKAQYLRQIDQFVAPPGAQATGPAPAGAPSPAPASRVRKRRFGFGRGS